MDDLVVAEIIYLDGGRSGRDVCEPGAVFGEREVEDWAGGWESAEFAGFDDVDADGGGAAAAGEEVAVGVEFSAAEDWYALEGHWENR